MNSAFVRRYMPKVDPIGTSLLLGESRGAAQAVSIVGVVGDVHQFGVGAAPRPEIYIPSTRRTMYVVAGVRNDAAGVVSSVRQTVRDLDPDQPMVPDRMLAEVLSDSLESRYVLGAMLGTLGAIALAMVTIAIYGVVAYSVTCRLPELGIRIALGATSASVLFLVVRNGMRLALTGAVLGTFGAVAVARALRNYLYGVSRTDALTYAVTAAVLASIALVA